MGIIDPTLSERGDMLTVFFNYPNPHVMIHSDPNCNLIQMHHVPDQRVINVNPENIKVILTGFINKEYTFAAQQNSNSLWLKVDLGSTEQDIGFVYTIKTLLGLHYTPFKNAPAKNHC
jgi:hypothetical protein